MNQYLFTRFLLRLISVIMLGLATNCALASTYSEDFEALGGFITDGNAATDFKIGPARFTDGMSGIARIPELYHSGNHAWMVKGGGTGIIQFDPGNFNVSFYAKAFSGSDGDTKITAFDQSNNVINSLTLNSANPFTKFAVSGLLGRIEFTNNDSANSRMNALDDFKVNAVPVPAAIWLFSSALLGVTGISRARKPKA
jgi:hypothetical protein